MNTSKIIIYKQQLIQVEKKNKMEIQNQFNK